MGPCSRWGRLDWAVNAAALVEAQPAPMADIAEQAWQQTIAADLTGMWLCLKFELAAMLRSGGGSIVNVSSINGLSATPLAGAYCTAKHGVQGMSKTAALEYAPRGVRINVVCPGAHRTPMLASVFEKLSPGAPDKAEAMYREFALLLPNTGSQGAQPLMQRLRLALLERLRSHGWPVTISIGAVSYEQAPPTLQEALHRADALMYAAKRSGKNRVRVETSQMAAKATTAF